MYALILSLRPLMVRNFWHFALKMKITTSIANFMSSYVSVCVFSHCVATLSVRIIFWNLVQWARKGNEIIQFMRGTRLVLPPMNLTSCGQYFTQPVQTYRTTDSHETQKEQYTKYTKIIIILIKKTVSIDIHVIITIVNSKWNAKWTKTPQIPTQAFSV